MLTQWLSRLRFLLKRKTHRDVDDELHFHIDQQTTANLAAGMSPKEAQRQAAIAFGGIQRTREQCREQRPIFPIETLLQDVRYAIRGFHRNPIFTLTILATLTLAIGATTAVFSVVDRILFRPLPYRDADRIVSLGLVQPLETQEFMLSRFYYDWKSTQKVFASMTAENAVTGECDLTERNPAQLSCPLVEGNFLPTLGISPVLGRNFLPEETRLGGPGVALISYGLWLTHYGLDPGILNKTMNIDGSPVRVIGVLPKEFEMPRLQAADILLPIAVDEAADRVANGGFGSPRRTFARLNPGVSLQQAEAALQPLFQQTQSQIPSEIRHDFHFKIRSLRDRQMQDVTLTAWVLLSAVFTVLLIACANVASLLMARGAMRQRELAVRSALGASRARLARQALTESLLLSLMGAIAGCALAEALLRLFIAIAPASIPYFSKIHLDLRIVCFTVVLSILCGVLFGLALALQRSSGGVMSGRTLTSTSHATVRQWLVIAQIAASMVLLAGAMLLLRSFRNLEDQNLGMSTDNTLTASITLGEHSYPTPQGNLNFYQRLATRLRFGPGIKLVSISDTIPPAPGHMDRRFEEIAIDGRPLFTPGTGGVVVSRMVSPEYFRALNIPIVQGEGFREEDMTASQRTIVLSKHLASLLFPNQNPIGQRLRFDRLMADETWATVVGVAADVKNSGLTKEEVPEFYRLRRNLPQDWHGDGAWGRTSVIVVRCSLPPDQTSRWIRSQVAALDPTLPVDIATLHQRVSKLADQPRFQTVLVSFFAATGLTLAIIGLYGVIAFLVIQRTQEIGIRIALGATHAHIRRLVLGKSLRLVAVGTALGLIAALSVSRLLSALLFQIGPYDPLTFASVPVLFLAAALAATLLPARSAAKVDPIQALRRD
ncbi:ABC transporter permease [Granulicella sp. L60]|uniref:ABC transporter permease n=1 Tax=Granulicella sp. L60 TaxID=1641866 RepID=UPI00131EAA3B|nr:ABC transporter permease [Granulicella sp. L60]